MQNIASLKKDASVSTKVQIREPFSAFSHLFGAILGFAGMVVLIACAGKHPVAVFAFALFGAGAISLFLASAIHHSVPQSSPWYESLKLTDHAAIYFMILGSYAPLCLISLPAHIGAPIFLFQTALAIMGIVFTFSWKNAPAWVRLSLYLGMGWVLALLLAPLSATWDRSALMLLVIEGLSYTIGCAVYALDKPHIWPGKFSAHDLWHIFVLAGCACHFIAIFKCVALPMLFM
jgi:hemolysin III